MKTHIYPFQKLACTSSFAQTVFYLGFACYFSRSAIRTIHSWWDSTIAVSQCQTIHVQWIIREPFAIINSFAEIKASSLTKCCGLLKKKTQLTFSLYETLLFGIWNLRILKKIFFPFQNLQQLKILWYNIKWNQYIKKYIYQHTTVLLKNNCTCFQRSF